MIEGVTPQESVNNDAGLTRQLRGQDLNCDLRAPRAMRFGGVPQERMFREASMAVTLGSKGVTRRLRVVCRHHGSF